MGNYVPCLLAPSHGKVILDKYLHTSSILSSSAYFETILVNQIGIPCKRIFDPRN